MKIAVTEGQAIKMGDVLVQVDSRESAILVRQMESKFARVQADRERLKMEKQLTEQQTKTLSDTRSSALEAATSGSVARDTAHPEPRCSWGAPSRETPVHGASPVSSLIVVAVTPNSLA